MFAVTQSTFAPFIGMIASVGVLAYFLSMKICSSNLQKSPSRSSIDTRALLWDTIREAIPFIITGSAIQLFQIIDQMTFIHVMSWFTDYTNTQLLVMFSYFSANPNKITMIFDCRSDFYWCWIPLSDRELCQGDLRHARLIQDNLTMLLLFILPATIGAVLVARPLYTVFMVSQINLLWDFCILPLYRQLF